ncbi:phage terminase small subunit [Streptomyces sp. NPDC001667]
MGARGPVPKRASARRRRNIPDGPDVVNVPSAPGTVPWPEPEGTWHPIARDWYSSLALSGQSQFYEPSDVATARYVAEAMSRNLDAGARFSAQLFAAVNSAMTELLTTEGARRRVRIELERAPAEAETPAGVTAIADYRTALGS